MHIVCQFSVTISHIRCTHRPNLQLPEDGQDIWPKHVGVLYNKYKYIVQLVGSKYFIIIIIIIIIYCKWGFTRWQ
jgi:hypothetical protein